MIAYHTLKLVHVNYQILLFSCYFIYYSIDSPFIENISNYFVSSGGVTLT